MLSSLLAGRAISRLIYLVTTVLLLPVWGEERYGAYAAAMAIFSWVVAPVVLGPEKAVLKFVPRAPRTGPMVSQALLAVARWLPAPLVAGFVLALVVDGAGRPALYLGVVAMLVSFGCMQLVVALYRVAGRPRYDSISFVVMSVAQLVLLGAATAGYVTPIGYVAVMIVVQLAVNLGLSLGLDRPSLAIRHRPRFLLRLGWTAMLLASTDLFLYGATGVLYAILAASTHAEQVGRFYALSTLWSAGVTMLLYVFRVYAPRVSLRLVGRAGSAGRDRAARLARLVATYNAGWLAVAGSVVALAGWGGIASVTYQLLVWVGLLVTRAPAVVGLLWASYQLENTDATAPRVVGMAAVAGLLGAAVAGLALVPALGVVGVILAYSVGDLGFALFVAVRGARRRTAT
jgi:O-antigen/teichoic acid export membrane protein